MQSYKIIVVIGTKDQLDNSFLKNFKNLIYRKSMENYKNDDYLWLGYDIEGAITECSANGNPFAIIYLNEEDQHKFDSDYRHSSTIALSATIDDDCTILLEQMLELSEQARDKKRIAMQCTPVVDSFAKANELEKIKKIRIQYIANLPKNIYLYGTEIEYRTFFTNNHATYNSFVNDLKINHDNGNYRFVKSTFKIDNNEFFGQTYACLYFNDSVKNDVERKKHGYQCLTIQALPDKNPHDLLSMMSDIRKNIFYSAPSLLYTTVKDAPIDITGYQSTLESLPKDVINNISEKYFLLKCKDVFFAPKAIENREREATNLARPAY